MEDPREQRAEQEITALAGDAGRHGICRPRDCGTEPPDQGAVHREKHGHVTRKYSFGFAAIDAGNASEVSPQSLATDQQMMLMSPATSWTVVPG